MSKFDEILNSSDASDALLGEQIDKLSEKLSDDYSVEWNSKFTIYSEDVVAIGKHVIVKALFDTSASLESGEMVLKIKKGNNYVTFKNRYDALVCGYKRDGSIQISGAYTLPNSYQASMNMPVIATAYTYHLQGVFEIN